MGQRAILGYCSLMEPDPSEEEDDMEIIGERILLASRETIWEMLNDPEVLRKCIPGCEELNVGSAERMSAIVSLKIGPIKARFTGEVKLEDLNPPASYAIVGEGKGGMAGFAKGRADVTLDEHEEGTLLRYRVRVAIGGKIAQLGGRLIQSTSEKLSRQFFDAFAAEVPGFMASKEAIA